MKVLLVEAANANGPSLRQAIERTDPQAMIARVTDTRSAMAALARFDMRKEHPDVVFVDLPMGQNLAFDVLTWLRYGTSPLKETPVVVLSNSRLPSEVDAAYRAGANAYICKPQSAAELEEALRHAADFWIRHNMFIGKSDRAANAADGSASI